MKTGVEIIEELVRADSFRVPIIFLDLSPEERTDKVTTLALALAPPSSLGKMYEASSKSRAFAAIVLSRNGLLLSEVPNADGELRGVAIRQNGRALKHVSESDRTPSLCLEAVRRDSGALRYVPFDLRTEEVCRVAAESAFSLATILEYVPESVRTDEFLSSIFEAEPSLFDEDFPLHYLTERVAKAIVSGAGFNLAFIPEELRTAEVCLAAVRSYGLSLKSVPVECRTPEVRLEAVRSNGFALSYLAEEERTPELCLEAVRSEPEALQHVPEPLRTFDLCLEAVRRSRDDFTRSYVPKHLIDAVSLYGRPSVSGS